MRGDVDGRADRAERDEAVVAALWHVWWVALVGAASASAHVLKVGTFARVKRRLQEHPEGRRRGEPGDWVLIGAGRLPRKEDRELRRAPKRTRGPAVLVTKPGIHIRGMDRNGVVLDGTKAGRAAVQLAAPADQNFGPLDPEGHPTDATAWWCSRPTA